MFGALVIDKPAGLTSHDVVARVRKILRERRVGHTGTLDPFATGVLVVLVGRATRLAQFLTRLEKEYEAVIRLGFATNTGDVTGERLPNSSSAVAIETLGEQQIEAAMASLRGAIEQVPPMYSAKKQQGRKLYELARQGKEVERAPVQVCVREFARFNESSELMKNNLDGTFDLKVRVVCSAGTYVRTLAEDFGKQLGVRAHLSELRRTRVGQFGSEQALTLDQLKQIVADDELEEKLITAFDVLSHLAAIELNADDIKKIRNGLPLKVNNANWDDVEQVRVCDGTGKLVAIANFDISRSSLQPRVVMPEDD
ncbi:MAG TPA: tRNA pseudouridine(55) synthase TruB [Pyrinomonadaceae bacterium]|nr:tRNA pseudouridine(55) synthase TruB [Pyrinomonadaceae bacterium]